MFQRPMTCRSGTRFKSKPNSFKLFSLPCSKESWSTYVPRYYFTAKNKYILRVCITSAPFRFLLFLGSFNLENPSTKPNQKEFGTHRCHQSQQRLHSCVTQLNITNSVINISSLFHLFLSLKPHSICFPLRIKVRQINHYLVSIAIGKPHGNTQSAVIPVLLLFPTVSEFFSI